MERRWSRTAGIAAVLVMTCVWALTACQKKPATTGEQPLVKQEKGTTVVIAPPNAPGTTTPNPDPFACSLSRGNRPDEDHVRWQNKSGRQVTLHFKAGWPFLEGQEDIKIDDGKLSPYYTLDSTKSGPFPYGINPPVMTSSGGPQDPSVSADP